MSKLQSIVNNLKSINETVFQELCDSFLILKNENYRVFSRTGSQSGKQKTTKGTPDTFLLLPNGKYIFVEYSTNITKGVSKLQEDIGNCLDTTKTNIPINQIAEIILCINFNLNTEATQSLQNLLSKTRISLTIYTLDSLALELNLQHRDLVHRYLNLPLDTGQIVTIDTFIEEYNKAGKGIATPLNNTFLHREEELQNIKNLIFQNDFLIITGVAGVGKTKIALEAIKSFLTENLPYNAFCISYKNCELLSDLHQHFDSEKDYILFVDDANRIDHISQIIGFYKSQRTGKLKILLTTRDYALPTVESFCQGFCPAQSTLTKLTDGQITDIIQAEPFNISNWQYHKAITRIADGTPRLAIMTALLALEEQNIYALNDVSDLFEKYFSTFVKDDCDFSSQFNIKCLGIVAFFNAIPYKDKNITEPILKNFDIDYSLFIDAIEKLDRLELVEIKYDYVKIPEQNLSTFFFYKAFVKDNLLSFKTLLQKYFDNNKKRFADCVIPANNTFGYDNVIQKLQPVLQNYWQTIKLTREKAFTFLDTFWFYLQNETLLFVYDIVENLPKSVETIFEVEYETNDFVHSQNNVIELISHFFIFQDNKLKEAIELVFEYVRKIPKHLPELIHKIRETLIFDYEDEGYGFFRQNTLFQILIDGLNKNDKLYSTAFHELAKSFLAFSFHQTKGGRKFTITFYDYPIPNDIYIQKFRENIWKNIDKYFVVFPENSLEVLQNYAQSDYRDRLNQQTDEIVKYDMAFVVEILEKYLNANSFEHCKYVHDQIRRYKWQKVENSLFNALLNQFTNPLYEMFLKIDWDYWRNKESFEFDNHEEFEKLKQEEIRSSFVFASSEEIQKFYCDFVYLKKAIKNEWSYNNSLELIINENCTKNFEVGFELLKIIIENNNEINYIPRMVFYNHLNNIDKAQRIWNLLAQNEFSRKTQWELSFFDGLDKTLISKEYVNLLQDSIANIKESIYIYFDSWKKYLSISPNLFELILKIIIEKNEREDNFILINDFSIEDDFGHFGNNLQLIKQAYLQQNIKQVHSHFDYNKKLLINILQQDSTFLIDYVNSLFAKKGNEYYLHDDHNLDVVWQIIDIEPILMQVFDAVTDKNVYIGIGKHFCSSFFHNLQENTKERAREFLLDYCRNNYENSDKINIIIDIVRHSSMNYLFGEILLLYVSLTQDVELFKRIWWIGNGGTYSGNVIIGDIDAANWRNILSIVEKSSVGIKLIPIKQYINSRIESELKQADWERQKKFIEND